MIVADNNLKLGEQLDSETDIDLEHTDKYTTEQLKNKMYDFFNNSKKKRLNPTNVLWQDLKRAV